MRDAQHGAMERSVAPLPALTRRRAWGLALRVALPALLCLLLFSITVFVIVLPAHEEALLSRKRQLIRELTRTACTALANYAQRAASGELTLAEAQARAIARVRVLRYGDDLKDYFWINDLQPRMIMHPYRPDLEGQDLSDYADPPGKRLFLEFVQVVRESGHGYVTYQWQWKDDPRRIVEKLSYVQLFEPWGWVVGTGVYLEDLRREVAAMTRRVQLATVGILAVVTVLTTYIIARGYRSEVRRLRVEARLSLLSRAVEQSHEGLALADLDGRLLVLNDAFARMHGATPGDLVGQPLADLCAPDATAPADARGAPLATLGEYSGELTHVRRDGTVFPALVHMSVVHDEQRAAVAMIVSVADITPLKQAEGRLRESERSLATLLSNLPGMAYRCRNDQDWPMEFVSEGCRDLTGYGPDELTRAGGVHYGDLIHPEDRAHVWNEVQSALQDERPFQLTYRLLTARGEEKWAWEQGQAVHDDDGALVALEGFVTDISARLRAEEERKELQEQLHHAQKLEAVGQLAGGVAHDFNNLLTVIMGSVEQLREDQLLAPRAAKAVEAIERASEQAAGVTRALLTFSHKLPTHKQRVNLTEVVEKSTRLLQRLLPATVKLVVAAPRDLELWVEADPTQLQQVLMNLAINARDAMPAGGTLDVAVRACSAADRAALDAAQGLDLPCARLTVRDTGCGMTPEMIARIFEPFFTTKERGQGTGLGLAIVHSIVEDHSGLIQVVSQPNAGTTFTILLPCQPGGAPVQPTTFGELPRGRGEFIILAEDNRQAREIMVAALRSLGYQVEPVADGAALLAACRAYAERVKLIVTDVDLPHRSGDACLRELRSAGLTVPAVIITGSVSPAIEVATDRTVMLRKPFQMSELGRVVRAALQHHAPKESST